MTDATDRARALLEAASPQALAKCVSGRCYFHTCPAHETKAWLREHHEEFLAVAITLADVVRTHRSPGDHMPSCIAVGGKEGCVPKCLDASKALAEWEKLLPEIPK